MAAARQQREASRDLILAAAGRVFRARDYLSVSVEDIAAEAGVSRMTFYRQFAGKAAQATELFADAGAVALPRLTAITGRDFHDRSAVRVWIAELFAADQADRQLLRAFTQASVVEPSFVAPAHRLIDRMIDALGAAIPAFALARSEDRARYLEAWLLLYELLDQSNHAAMGSGIATDPLVVDVLANRFLAFVDDRRTVGREPCER